MLKNEINIKKENTRTLVLLFKIVEISFTGINPPDEIMLIAKFSELKVLNPKIFKNIKINIVKAEYRKNIFIVCFNISELLNDKKFVNDFFKLSS
tara:strand:+ start:383 stop:667 length:285 start_codon:yes stop_codon:yes gene_type:complete